MKKLSSLTALLVLVAACSGGNTEANPNTSSAQPTQAAATTTQAAATTTQAAAATTQAAATTTQATATTTQAAATSTQAAATTTQATASSTSATQQNSKQMVPAVKVPSLIFTRTEGFGRFTSAEETAFAAAVSVSIFILPT